MPRTVPPDVVEAAARFLAAHPHASNVDLLRFLTASRGEGAVAGIAINRVRALVREPALQWLREERVRTRNGTPPETSDPAASRGAAAVPSTPSRDPGSSPPQGPAAPTPSSSSAPPPTERVRPTRRPGAAASPDRAAFHQALEEAFRLGAESRSRGDLVRNWSRLLRLRDRWSD